MLCSHVSGSRYERPPAQSLQHLRPHLLFRDTTSSDSLSSCWDLKHPKTDWDFRSRSQGLPHPTGRVVCSILPIPRFWKKKKSRSFLETRSWVLVQGHSFTSCISKVGSVHTWAPAPLEHFKMACWKFGLHVFFSSPVSTLGMV